MFRLRKLITLLLAITLVFGAVGFSATTALAASCSQYHTVQPGETLYLIGLRYGVTWRTLVNWNNISKPNKIYAGSVLCVSRTGRQTYGTGGAYTPIGYGYIPSFIISSVSAGESVTIQTAYLPAHNSINVFMGAYGTLGENGTLVDTFKTGNGGYRTLSFDIPANLQDNKRIAIRLESKTTGSYSYNWFYNKSNFGTGGAYSGGDGYTGYPTISIASVSRNASVKINAYNFPANDTFVVRMDVIGTRGINGVKVDTIKTGDGGSFSATFSIPGSLSGARQIAIRLESPTSGYYAYNWFYNR